MRVFFLEAASRTPLTKSFALDDKGQIAKQSYPFIRNFNSLWADVGNIDEFADQLRDHANQYHCLLKGKLHKELVNESRAGATHPSDTTRWICLDVDRDASQPDAESFIQNCLPPAFHDVDYIVQESSSSGIYQQDELSIHIFMLLERPVAAPALKLALEQFNLENKHLRSQLELTASGATLRYRLDTTTCQNDKLIYIAPPKLGDGLTDQLTPEQRVRVVAKGRRALELDLSRINPTAIKAQRNEIVNELRAASGLDKKIAKYTVSDGLEILTNPDQAVITEQKHERGFVYMNLNGGDSWAYYHPEQNPTFIYSFKEPGTAVRTADLLPDYWAQAQRNQADHNHEQTKSTLVFRDFRTATYWNGYYDPATDTARMAKASGKEQLHDFLKQNGMARPKFIEDWDYRFDPTNNLIIDHDAKFLNRFVRTPYMRTAPNNTSHIGPTITKVAWHVLGESHETFDHFMNWLAFIFQKRTKTGTAWVITGTEGTGKGVLYHEILRPLIGDAYCAQKPLSALQDQFNDWEETTILLNMNEARISDTTQTTALMNRLKAMITEPSGHVRRMHQSAVEVPLYTNILITSNNQDAVYISAEDRRFNVAPRQENKIFLTAAEIDAIRVELPAFAAWLNAYAVDEQAARSALINDAKKEMQQAALTSPESLFNAVRESDLDYFIRYLTANPPPSDALTYSAFDSAIKQWMRNIGEPSYATRDELQAVYSYLQGQRFTSPNKFTKILSHNNLKTKRVKIDGTTTYALDVNWTANEEDVKSWLTPTNVTPIRKVS